MLFFAICESDFLSVIISLKLQEFPLAFLVVQFWWQQIALDFVYLKIIFILPWLFKDIFNLE